MTRWLALALALAISAPAAAGSFWEPAPRDDEDQNEVVPDAPSDYEALIVLAREHAMVARYRAAAANRARTEGSIRRAREEDAEMHRAAVLTVKTLEKAATQRPAEASVQLWLGNVKYRFLYSYYDDQALVSKRDQIGTEAIEHWRLFEELSPKDPRRVNFVRTFGGSGLGFNPFSGTQRQAVFPYQFGRSLVYTKLGGDDNYERAIADYDFILANMPRALDDFEVLAQYVTNSAEILMAVGRLEEAIERYRDGIDLSMSNGPSQVLYSYGLAVALDRSGFTQSALDIMREAATVDTAPFDQLHKTTVFFVPHGDIYYYHALGHEALGHCEAAIEQYKAFIARSASKRYHKAARDHIRYLRRHLKDRKKCFATPKRIRTRGWTL